MTIAILPSLLMSLESKKTLGIVPQFSNNIYYPWPIFLVSGIFPGKADSVILLGLKYTINPEHLMKIVRAIFEKFEILNFFSCELPLILGLGGK